MRTFNKISHKDKIVERKVNFFADYFQLNNRMLGKDQYFDFETHHSIIVKINYLFKHNNNWRASKYLVHYLSHSFFNAKTFFDKFNSYSAIKPHTGFHINLKPHEIRAWLKNNPSFEIDLIALEKEITSTILDVALKELISMLMCKHSLSYHLKDISYLTKIIVSQFRYEGFTQNQTRDIISKIMSKNPKIFPLPQEILNLKGQHNYDETVNKFLSTRNFKEQFLGILNFYTLKPTDEIILFRLMDYELNKNDEFVYNNVHIIGRNHKQLSHLKKLVKSRPFFKDFFSPRKMCLCFTSVNYKEVEMGKQIALSSITKATEYINHTLGYNGRLDPYFTLSTNKDFNEIGANRKYRRIFLTLDEDNIERLNRDNVYHKLANRNSPAVDQFLQFEYLYHRALLSNELNDYWQYLECLISVTQSSNNSEDKIIESTAKILAKQKQLLNIDTYETHIFDLLSYNGMRELEYCFTSEVTSYIYDNWENVDIVKMASKFKLPIIKKLKDIINFSKTRKYRSMLTNYYSGILLELYESRNYFVHQGISNELAKIKLVHIVPNMIQNIRYSICDELGNINYNNLSQTIEKLIKYK